MEPTLSVLMPNYNHARFLPESLGAILSQSFAPAEIIVLDDASTDNSVEVIESFARRDSRVRLVRNERNMGVEWSVNRLLELASSDYIYSPSADDKVLPGLFEKSMMLLAQNPQAGLCSTVARLIGEDGEDRGIRALPVVSARPRFLTPAQVSRMLLKYGRWFDAGSVIYRREALVKEGGYRKELGAFADTFAILVLALRYGACFVPEPLHCWRQMATGYSLSVSDWRFFHERGREVLRLMRTVYSDLFPAEYVKLFGRHWNYMTIYLATQQTQIEQEKTVDQLKELMGAGTGLIDRSLERALRLGIRGQALLSRTYGMARFGPWRWWFMGRLSILMNLKRLILLNQLRP